MRNLFKLKINATIRSALMIPLAAGFIYSCGDSNSGNNNKPENPNITSEYGKYCKDLKTLLLNDGTELDCKLQICIEDVAKAFCAKNKYCSDKYGEKYSAVSIDKTAPKRTIYTCKEKSNEGAHCSEDGLWMIFSDGTKDYCPDANNNPKARCINYACRSP